MKRSLLLHALACAIAVGTLVSCSRAAKPEADRQGEQGKPRPIEEQVRGTVVYEHKGGIYKTHLGEKEAVRLAEKGSWPRWSPDGRYVAFVRGKDIARVSADGGDVEVLAPVENPRAVAYHPDGSEVLFTDGDRIFAASIDGSQVRAVLDGYTFRELDITADGKTLIATVKRHGYQIYGFDLASGDKWKVSRGCSASLSPDGKLVSNNGRGHREMYLRDLKSGDKVITLHAPPGVKFDNQFWSNEDDWLVSKTEDEAENILVHQVSRDRATQVTFTGDCDRPDLYVGTND